MQKREEDEEEEHRLRLAQLPKKQKGSAEHTYLIKRGQIERRRLALGAGFQSQHLPVRVQQLLALFMLNLGSACLLWCLCEIMYNIYAQASGACGRAGRGPATCGDPRRAPGSGAPAAGRRALGGAGRER